MAISICLSTVLIKQHSLFDVFGGIGMCAVFIYGMHAMEDRKVQRLAAERKRIGTY
jgi:membrane-associated phospholipid phosphatase